MRICHIVPSLQLEHGGPSRSVRALCAALARAGEQVELLTTHPDAPDQGASETTADGLAIHTFRRDWPRQLCPSAGLRRALTRRPADIVHHHGLWLRTLHYAAHDPRRALVVSPRGMMSEWAWHHHRWQKALASRLVHPGAFARAAGWHATSAAEAAEIGALGYSQPVVVAPNGVALPDAAAIDRGRAYWLDRCPELATHRVALFYGRFHRKKRVLELMALWRALAPPDWLLLLVGIPEEYSVEGLRQQAKDFSATAGIRIFDGSDAPAPYPLAELFLLPSHNENFGLTVIEAMAHGVPVLVTDSTPWDVVNLRAAGWCVPWTRYESSVHAALQMSPAALRERGEAARMIAATGYSWDACARSVAEFYRKLTPAA